jgi:D-lactate dehydrogenase
MIAAKANGDISLAKELECDFRYDGLDTCAVDGMCAVACPIGIDTGDLVKTLRQRGRSYASNITAEFLARNLGQAQYAARLSIHTGHAAAKIMGNDGVTALSKLLGKINKGFPKWNRAVTKVPTKARTNNIRADATAVYFPACIGRMLGKNNSGELHDIFLTLCKRAGIKIFLPEQSSSLCCGLPFSSKGFDEARNIAEQNIVNAIEQWTDGGRLPLIIDANSCSQTLKNLASLSKYRILDAIEFAANELLPELQPRKLPQTAAIHPTCSAIKTGIAHIFEDIARVCAENVVVPISVGCCGFAGDRGFLVPELTESATADEACELRGMNCTDGYSGNITCEIAMSYATGLNYRSILCLLEEATRPQS